MMSNSFMALPVQDFKETIVKCIRDNQIIIIIGETGSGKTTQSKYIVMNSILFSKLWNVCVYISSPVFT